MEPQENGAHLEAGNRSKGVRVTWSFPENSHFARSISGGSVGVGRRHSSFFIQAKSHEKLHARTFLDKAKSFERFHEEEEEAPPAALRVSRAALVLWCLFGASGWWSANAIYAQLPLFIATLPEAEHLGNLIAATTQFGNLCPILYKFSEPYVSLQVRSIIQAMQAVAITTLLACAALWDCSIGGQSLPLLVLTAIAGGVGCMTDVTYWAYAMSYPARCTKAISVGMTAGGLILNLLAVVQMASRSPRDPLFGPSTFFMVAAALQGVWWLTVFAVEGRLPECCRSFLEQIGSKGKSIDPLLESYRKRLESGTESVYESPPLGPAPPPVSMDDVAATQLREESQIRKDRCMKASCFVIYAATYTLPTLLPFAAGAYPEATEKEQLLLWMLLSQNTGDVLGRMLAPRRREEWKNKMILPAKLMLPTAFLIFFVCAIHPQVMQEQVPYAAALVLLPGLTFIFYFTKGIIVTLMFLRAREVYTEKEAVERLASNMGFCGQMGALSANGVAFVMVSVLHIMGP